MKPVFPGESSPASNDSLKVVIGYDDLPDDQRAMKICQCNDASFPVGQELFDEPVAAREWGINE